ncbi:hypothetical protein CBS101457_003070 [Exobasidium rhododendri]|nr:hypothetical protein CBS101457_003070 [Exobasidium rhododendri]
MTGSVTLPAVFVSSVVTIVAAIVGIVVVWLPAEDYAPQYSYGSASVSVSYASSPTPKLGVRIFMTIFQALAMILALTALINTGRYMRKAWHQLQSVQRGHTNTLADRGESGVVPANPPPYVAAYSRSKVTLLTAWNEVPSKAIGVFWVNLIPLIIIAGLAALGIQAVKLRSLQAIYDTETSASSDSTTFSHSAWPLIVSLSMFVVIVISSTVLYSALLIKEGAAKEQEEKIRPRMQASAQQDVVHLPLSAVSRGGNRSGGGGGTTAGRGGERGADRSGRGGRTRRGVRHTHRHGHRSVGLFFGGGEGGGGGMGGGGGGGC